MYTFTSPVTNKFEHVDRASSKSNFVRVYVIDGYMYMLSTSTCICYRLIRVCVIDWYVSMLSTGTCICYRLVSVYVIDSYVYMLSTGSICY